MKSLAKHVNINTEAHSVIITPFFFTWYPLPFVSKELWSISQRVLRQLSNNFSFVCSRTIRSYLQTSTSIAEFFVFDFNCSLNVLSTCHVQYSRIGSQLKTAQNASCNCGAISVINHAGLISPVTFLIFWQNNFKVVKSSLFGKHQATGNPSPNSSTISSDVNLKSYSEQKKKTF